MALTKQTSFEGKTYNLGTDRRVSMHAALDTFTDAIAQLIDNGYIASGSDTDNNGFVHTVASGSLFVTSSAAVGTNPGGTNPSNTMVLCLKPNKS